MYAGYLTSIKSTGVSVNIFSRRVALPRAYPLFKYPRERGPQATPRATGPAIATGLTRRTAATTTLITVVSAPKKKRRSPRSSRT